MLLSRKLWLELQTPPDARWKFLIFDRMLTRNSWTPWAYLTVVLFVLTAGAIVLFNGLLWGAFTAYRTARVLMRERQRNALDALYLTPIGEAGIGWKAFQVSVHYDIELANFIGLRKLTLVTVRFPLLFLLPITVVISLTAGQVVLQAWYVNLLLVWVTIAAMMYLDPIYGLISGGLVGILANHYIRGDAPFFAALIVALLQLAGYLAMLLVGVLMLAGVHNDVARLTLPLICVAAYVFVRELTIWGLWLIIQRHLSV